MTYHPMGGEWRYNCVHEWEPVPDSYPSGSTDPDPFVELYCPRCEFRKLGRASEVTPKPPPDPPTEWMGITVGTDVRKNWRHREGAFWRAGVLAAKGEHDD